jgi:FlaG/FlaF family flagellin (archaellin)
MTLTKFICSVAPLLCIGLTGIRAQTITARLTGSVTDASGAAHGNASVTITNERKGAQRVVITVDDGQYVAVALPLSEYDVKVTIALLRRRCRTLLSA